LMYQICSLAAQQTHTAPLNNSNCTAKKIRFM
jgi:hypothetical protein